MTGRLKVYDADTGTWSYVDGAGAQANLLRYVPLPAYIDSGIPSTTASVSIGNTPTYSGIPTNAVAVSVMASCGSSSVGTSQRLYIYAYGVNTTALGVCFPGKVVGHYEGTAVNYVPLGGDRQFSYGYTVGTAGTLTPSVQVTGYWVIDVSTAIASGGGSIIGVGAAFPGAPLVNDRFWRTDFQMEFFYDGTRWLSSTLYLYNYPVPRAIAPFTVSTSVNGSFPRIDGGDIWVEDYWADIYVASPNSGTVYWTLTAPDNGAQLSTINNTPALVFRESRAINAIVSQSSSVWLQVDFTKVSTPGGIYAAPHFSYRWIVT